MFFSCVCLSFLVLSCGCLALWLSCGGLALSCLVVTLSFLVVSCHPCRCLRRGTDMVSEKTRRRDGQHQIRDKKHRQANTRQETRQEIICQNYFEIDLTTCLVVCCFVMSMFRLVFVLNSTPNHIYLSDFPFFVLCRLSAFITSLLVCVLYLLCSCQFFYLYLYLSPFLLRR